MKNIDFVKVYIVWLIKIGQITLNFELNQVRIYKQKQNFYFLNKTNSHSQSIILPPTQLSIASCALFIPS